MGKCYVLVHSSSYRYIKNIADYIHHQIRKNSQAATELRLCKRLDEAPMDPDSIAWVIGEPFNFSAKASGCKYVFLNFSVVSVVGPPLDCSIRGFFQIRRKKKMLAEKMNFLDYVLDYWPAQTPQVKEWAQIPVGTFPVAMLPINQYKEVENPSRKYDVCIVGGDSPRRLRIIAQLRRLGLRLSPTNGVDLEEAAVQSKIVLNVHSERCNHLESPRMIGAFMSKSALVSEHAYGMENCFPRDIYVSAKYGAISKAVESLLANPIALREMQEAAYTWVTGTYLTDCNLRWSNLVREVSDYLYPNGELNRTVN